jgi:ectoine hydroxylase-related dioxygenase (phytanoyl-CoA dioxygenase family)
MSTRRQEFQRTGYLVLQGACTEALPALRRTAEQLLQSPVTGASFRFGKEQKKVLGKLPQLAQQDATFRALAQHPPIVDVLEELIGPACLFRDVLIVKPALDGAVVRDHQDIAYWDVAPPELVISAWVALDDAPLESGCLEVVPGSHRELVQHRVAAGQLALPDAVTQWLRRMASLTGTGDNPRTARQKLFARGKNFALGTATRLLPFLGDLNDLHIDPRRVPARVPLPIRAGDVIFFDSRLIHASGPNTSQHWRRAYIASYMSVQCRVPASPTSGFLPARA